MLYHLNEFKNAALQPTHMWSEALDLLMTSVPGEQGPFSKMVSASAEMVERSTRIFPKPEFGINTVERGGDILSIEEHRVMMKPFCSLVHFRRFIKNRPFQSKDPKVLIVAPLSGHFATLLRDTARAMIPDHDVYITDWVDAKQVPLKEGIFSFDHYVDYLLDFIRYLGKDLHLIAVCQPSVPVMCVTSLLAEYKEPCQPKTMTLMGGPIDTRINPGKVNEFAQEHSIDWYRRKLIAKVPHYYPGGGRRVIPGFVMLTGFMSLNLERHQEANVKLFQHLIQGDDESAEAHRKFYDEYRAVMDLPEDYFLQSIDYAFMRYLLPKGMMTWRGYLIRPDKITNTALLTVEGELDDISCPGQTYAAHDLCTSLPRSMKAHHFQEGVGHYGIFNGRRWRQIIQPRIAEFIRAHS